MSSILAGQHDHPMLAIPAGVERDLWQGEICVGDFLSSVLAIITITVDHECCGISDYGFHDYEPIRRANFSKMASDCVHHPEALGMLGQVLGAIRQKVFATYAVVTLSSCK